MSQQIIWNLLLKLNYMPENQRGNQKKFLNFQLRPDVKTEDMLSKLRLGIPINESLYRQCFPHTILWRREKLISFFTQKLVLIKEIVFVIFLHLLLYRWKTHQVNLINLFSWRPYQTFSSKLKHLSKTQTILSKSLSIPKLKLN